MCARPSDPPAPGFTSVTAQARGASIFVKGVDENLVIVPETPPALQPNHKHHHHPSYQLILLRAVSSMRQGGFLQGPSADPPLPISPQAGPRGRRDRASAASLAPPTPPDPPGR